MVEVPSIAVTPWVVARFHDVLGSGDLGALPEEVPRWVFLDWLTRQGCVLHGSNRSDLTWFEPREPHDLSPDDFSKRKAVFASSDALWALMYAVVDRPRKVKRMLSTAVQIEHHGSWTPMRYFLSVAPHDSTVEDSSELLRSGAVYVLDKTRFEQMPPYEWPGVGKVLEPHWACPHPVEAALRVPVRPADLPLPVRIHDADRVDAASKADPWGFPWLEAPA